MMRSTRIVACLGIVVAVSGATAAETETVQSLLKKEFAIVGVITSPVGPGLFLQKKDQLFVITKENSRSKVTVGQKINWAWAQFL